MLLQRISLTAGKSERHFLQRIFMKIRGGDNYILESLLQCSNNYVVLCVHELVQTATT